jgi:Sulfatase
MRYGHSRPGSVARLTRISLVFLALAASGQLTGCSREPRSPGEVEPVGLISLNLTAAPSVTLNSVTYTITGSGFTKTGSIDTSGSPTVSGTIGGIPAGKGYNITLTATSVEGGTTFTGSATFDVTAGATTSVTIHLNGSARSGNGSVSVTGTINVNPRIDEVTVTPQTVFVGGAIKLSAVGTDPDGSPQPLSYYWSTTGGVIDDPIGPSATLTSAKPGTFTINLTISDGDATDTATATVTFVRPVVAGGGGGAGGGAGPTKPNILLIIADDLGAEATSLYPALAGTKGQVPIPNIEALASNGVVFDNAWASPLCSPTRATIVSGKYGFRTGVTTVFDVLPTSTVTLFDRLTAESPTYSQAFFGKYHLGGGGLDPRPGIPYAGVPEILQHVRDLGITTYRGILGGALVDYYNWTTYDINGPEVANTTYTTTVLANYAIDFIHQQQATKPDQPWFIYQAFNAPHAANGGNNPFQVPPPELHHVDLSSVGNPAAGDYATNIPVYQADIQIDVSSRRSARSNAVRAATESPPARRRPASSTNASARSAFAVSQASYSVSRAVTASLAPAGSVPTLAWPPSSGATDKRTAREGSVAWPASSFVRAASWPDRSASTAPSRDQGSAARSRGSAMAAASIGAITPSADSAVALDRLATVGSATSVRTDATASRCSCRALHSAGPSSSAPDGPWRRPLRCLAMAAAAQASPRA